MKPNLKDLKTHLEGIPNRRLPLGKNAWLQEWEETKQLVEGLEKELLERLSKLPNMTNFDIDEFLGSEDNRGHIWTAAKEKTLQDFIEEILGDV